MKLKTSSIDFEIDVEGIEEEDKQFIQDIIMMIDRKARTHSEDLAVDELKKKYAAAKEGYNALNPKIEGFHNGVDEFIAIAVDNEYESQINIDTDKDPVNEIEKQYIEVAAEIAGTVENIEGQNSNNIDSEELSKVSEEASKLPIEPTLDESPKSNAGITLLNGSKLTDDPSIRLNTNGKKIYQMYYKCPNCKNTGKRYIPKESIFTNCHSCHYKMRIKSASDQGFPNKDAFQNVFIAGIFKRL
ncbi:hypothetical protein [Bacillus sp. Brlt_9]|uniref:hypothetical protein n=1 Tax=Bacillus sp. Brlt_9 TaxID=3110916 RepID=UPI003F7C10BF